MTASDYYLRLCDTKLLAFHSDTAGTAPYDGVTRVHVVVGVLCAMICNETSRSIYSRIAHLEQKYVHIVLVLVAGVSWVVFVITVALVGCACEIQDQGTALLSTGVFHVHTNY